VRQMKFHAHPKLITNWDGREVVVVT